MEIRKIMNENIEIRELVINGFLIKVLEKLNEQMNRLYKEMKIVDDLNV